MTVLTPPWVNPPSVTSSSPTPMPADSSTHDALPHGLTPEVAMAMLRTMLLSRLYDERALTLQRSGRISFCVTSIGEEAAVVGSVAALQANDWLFPAYRQHAAAFYRGASLQSMVDQLFGNADDPAKGRQMPCHHSHADLRFVSVSSVIGTQISQAVGAGMAEQRKRSGCLAATYFGDGATSANDFHAGMNLAAVQKAPVLFFCVNNQFAISVPVAEQTASAGMAVKAQAYGMNALQVDGNDALAVWMATQQAAQHARNGNGPTLVELQTYRIMPHSSSDDPTRYRNEAEAQRWRTDNDPIQRLQARLINAGITTPEAVAQLKTELNEALLVATKAAEAKPLPPLDSLFEDVYAECPPALLRQREALRQALGAEAYAQGSTHAEGAFPL
jgi:pyruvate dehydrogenase E1 component alpha subunit